MATSGNATFYNGGKPGRRTAVTPKSASANLGRRSIARLCALGTSSVSTQTLLVGVLPACKVTAIKFVGTAAVTGTSITGEVFKLSADGATQTTLQSAATNLKLTASTDEVVQAGALTATTANLTVAADTVIEVTFTASSITAGPGDVIVIVEYFPVEDSESANAVSIGRDIL